METSSYSHPSTLKQEHNTWTSYNHSCFHCLKLKKMNSTRTGQGGLGKWSNRVSSLLFANGLCFPLMLSCFSSLSKTKSLIEHHVQMAMRFSVFQTQNSPLILHHFQKFNLPNDPHHVLFELVMLIFKIIKQWRFSKLRVEHCPVPLSSSSFTFFSFFFLFLNFCPILLIFAH